MTLSAPQASVAASIALHAFALALVASSFVPRPRDAGKPAMTVRFEVPQPQAVVVPALAPQRLEPARPVARPVVPVVAPASAVPAEAAVVQAAPQELAPAVLPADAPPSSGGAMAVAKAAAPAAAPPGGTPPSFDAAYLRNPAPAYPLMSKRRGEKGKVMLDVRVLADGSAEQVKLRASSGHERLDQAAMDAVRQWRFVPARSGDDAVAAWVTVPVVFVIDG